LPGEFPSITDVVAKVWWTMRQATFVGEHGGADQELYRYGIHYPEMRICVTVGPGTYHARLKFAETQFNRPRERAMTIWINGRKVVEGFDVLATAGEADKAVDLVFNSIDPEHGVIELRLKGDEILGRQCEAMIQALEIGPGDGGTGATAKTIGTW
jgi:malectin (di-glucose binding ER protein)